MRRSLSALLAVSLLAFGVAALGSSSPRSVTRAARPVEAPMCVASSAEPMLGCGEIRCTRDTDCPSTCGGCITWSGTCALFQPR